MAASSSTQSVIERTQSAIESIRSEQLPSITHTRNSSGQSVLERIQAATERTGSEPRPSNTHTRHSSTQSAIERTPPAVDGTGSEQHLSVTQTRDTRSPSPFRAISDDVFTGAHELSTRETAPSLALIALIIILWGFTSGTMEILNADFQDILNLTKAEASGLQASFYAAYLVGPLTWSSFIVHRFGHRWNLMTGLLLHACGSLAFVPSCMYASFGGFCASTFLLGCGFSTLDVSVYSFVSICGPPRYAEMRSNAALGLQSAFAVCGLVVASYVSLAPLEGASLSQAEAMTPIQWTFLGIAFAALALLALSEFWPLREITDADMDQQVRLLQSTVDWEDKPLRQQYQFWVGLVAISCFCGAQGGVAAFFINYVLLVKERYTKAEAARFMAVALGAFAVTRFSVALGMRYVRPRIVLLLAFILTIAFLCAAMGTTGDAGLTMIILVFAAKAPVFPTLYSLALKGLGRHTKFGSALLVTCLAGTALWVPATGATEDAIGSRAGLCVPLVGIVVASSYPIYLNMFRRKELDAIRESELGIKHQVAGAA